MSISSRPTLHQKPVQGKDWLLSPQSLEISSFRKRGYKEIFFLIMTIIPYMCCLTQKWQNLRNSWPIPIQAPTLLEIPVCMYTVSKTCLWNVYIEILPLRTPHGCVWGGKHQKWLHVSEYTGSEVQNWCTISWHIHAAEDGKMVWDQPPAITLLAEINSGWSRKLCRSLQVVNCSRSPRCYVLGNRNRDYFVHSGESSPTNTEGHVAMWSN